MKKYIKGDLTGLMLCKLALHSVDAAEGNFFSNNWSEKNNTKYCNIFKLACRYSQRPFFRSKPKWQRAQSKPDDINQ